MSEVTAQPSDQPDELFARREGTGAVLQAAVQVLSDGKPRRISVLVEDAIRAKLLPETANKNTVTIDLRAYVFRMIALGRSPVIVENVQTHEFRLNRPVDDWPPAMLPARPRYTAEATVQAVEQRMRETAVGKNPAAFEIAVCDAFGVLGFTTTHIGGLGAPDGKLDAPLGPLAYSAILECKSTPTAPTVRNSQPEEPAKFRDQYGAEFALLVGPGFEEEQRLRDELLTHNVSLWTIDDIVTALRNDVDTYECRALFAAGVVRDRLAALEWERVHGAEKRARVVRDILLREGYAAQRSLVGHIAPAEAPVLSVDAAMVLVEAELRKANVTSMATRGEVQVAMNDLLRAGEAVAVPDRDGIVITRAPS